MSYTYTVAVSGRTTATMVVTGGEGPVMLVNNDPVNSVYLGDNDAIRANDLNQTIALDAGDSLAVDGENDMYAIAATGVTVFIDKIRGGIHFSRGPSNITHIATTATVGVGATGGPGTIGDGSNFSVLMPADAEGYELVVNPVDTATKFFACDIEIDHVDSATGQVVASENFTTGNWAGKSGSTACVRGKLFGDEIQLTVTCAGNSFIQGIPCNFGATVFATGVFINILSLPVYIPGVARVLPPGLIANPIGSLNSILSTSVAAAGNTVLNGGAALVPYHGPVAISLSTSSGGGFMGRVSFNFFSVFSASLGLGVSSIVSPSVQINGAINWSSIFPALACQAVWVPQAAVAGTVSHAVTGQYD